MIVSTVFMSLLGLVYCQTGLLVVDESWPLFDPETRYVSDLDVSSDNDLFVFERVDRNWVDPGTFDANNNYMHQYLGPIMEDTISRMDIHTGVIKDSFGSGLFYMPHSLTIDGDDNVWLTDAALHQVFKFNKDKELEMVLGKKLEPAPNNEDNERFCKPNDVAVASNGDFFVSDGYCNQRIVKFNSAGERIGQITHGFNLPHSLALIEEEDLICVGVLKNHNILCLSAGLNDPSTLGQLIKTYDHPRLECIYKIAYDKINGLLYGTTIGTKEVYQPRGFTIDFHSNDTSAILAEWNSDPLLQVPHGLTTAKDGNAVYVGEVIINQKNIWKFTPGSN